MPRPISPGLSTTRRLGMRTLSLATDLRGMLALSIITLTALLPFIHHDKTPLWPLLRKQIARGGVRLLTWATLLAAGLGIVVVGQILGVFSGLGANDYLGAILVSTVIHELGPIVMSVLVLSVVATAMVIDLATARITEKLEVVNVQAGEIARTIIVPRVLGLGLSIFCLTIYFISLTLVFAYTIVLLQNIPLAPSAYLLQIADSLSLRSFLLLAVKSLSFGGLIGLVACYEGLVRPIDLEHLSGATIRTVVGGMTLCALLDTLFISTLLL